jgi:pilus assembly protein CpaC
MDMTLHHSARKGGRTLLASTLALAMTTVAVLPLDPKHGLTIGAAHANSSANVIRIANSGPGASKRINLGLNKAIVIDLPAAAHDILVADPSIADAVTRTASRIYLFGKAVGQTNIFVFGPNGEEVVTLDLQIERDITGLQQQLARFIPDSDITVEIINDNIVLNGTVRTPQDASRATQLAGIFLTGGEATTRNITAVGAQNGGDAAIFAEERQRSQIVNLLSIDGEDQVTLKVTVAEVSRQVLKQIGFNTSASSVGGSLFGTFDQALGSNLEQPNGLGGAIGALGGNFGRFGINSQLNALERSGVMRTLAEPSLTAISGEPASFFVGGEFRLVQDITVTPADENNPARQQYNVGEVDYGIRLNFTPVVLSAGRISLKVRTEVSEPTFEGSVGSSAGTLMSIRRREAETSVELPSGGSIVIAGLIRDDIRQAMSGVPGASKIPVLGSLFRSRDFVRNETEMVIIATPYLVRPVARNQLARPDDNFNAASDGAGFFLGRVNRVYGRTETDLPKGRYHGAVGFIYK